MTWLCGVLLVSGVLGIAASLFNTPPAWFTIIFEVAIVAATAFGVLVGRGWYRSGPSLTLVCVAGTVAAGSLFGYLGAGRTLLGLDLTVLLGTRLLGAAGVMGLAGWIVFARSPGRSLPYLLRGVGLGVAAAAAGALTYAAAGLAAQATPVAGVVVGAAGAMATLVLASVSLHCLIRGFEVNAEVPAEGE